MLFAFCLERGVISLHHLEIGFPELLKGSLRLNPDPGKHPVEKTPPMERHGNKSTV